MEAEHPVLDGKECQKCRRLWRENCDGMGWLEAIGPKDDGSYVTSRPCPNDTSNALRPI